MKNIVVVPDGLDAAVLGRAPRVSWVFETVLRKVLEEAAPGDRVFLTPANSFGQAITEHEAAANYLRQANLEVEVYFPQIQSTKYLNTRDNATVMRDYPVSQGHWPLENAKLYVFSRHAGRAAMIFKQEGYQFSLRHVEPDSLSIRRPVVPRLWYYNNPLLHNLYEFLAGLLFRFRIK